MSGKNWEKSGNFEMDDKWEPWVVFWGIIRFDFLTSH